MSDIIIYIDDSGQLHPNYPHSSVFVYGGYWTTKEADDEIIKHFGKLKRQIFKSGREIKASSMTENIKINIIRRLKNKFKNSFNPIFVSVDVKSLTIDFTSKQTVQLHKNYLIRRFVETAIKNKRYIIKDDSSVNVNIHIDDQSKTSIGNFDSLDRYITKMMRGNYRNVNVWLHSNANFTVKYEDSKASNGIQIADILANSKMDYHIGKFKRNNLKTFMKNKEICSPLKLPNYWTSIDIQNRK